MIRLIFFTAFLGAAVVASECSAVNGERILGRDLKSASAGFDSTPNEAVIAYSPFPGVRRTLTPRELARYGAAAGSLCFERAGRLLASNALETAMRKSFGSRTVDIEIVDYPKARFPDGTLEFPLAGLARPSPGAVDVPVIWRGRLRFDGRKSLSLWAAVRLAEHQQWVEAVEPLAPGIPVTANQIRTRTGPRFPSLFPGIAAIDAFIGRAPRRSIAASQELSPSWFVDPPLVSRGDRVQAEVVSGSVSLRFDGRAESSGSQDDFILIVDPQLGRRMKARVAGKGKVVVNAQQLKRDGSGGADGVGPRLGPNPE